MHINVEGSRAALDPPIMSLEVARKRVSAINLKTVRRQLAKEGKEKWTKERLHYVEVNYRRFLIMCLLRPYLGVVPTAEIDEMWHAHILDTRKYANDCLLVFGRFLHHQPASGRKSEEYFQRMFDLTCKLYRELFGDNYRDSFKSLSRVATAKARVPCGRGDCGVDGCQAG